jgi:DNA polymerase III epsilon subunit-like protein
MRFAVIDTETTGLPDDPDARVVEVGIVVLDTENATPDVPVRSFQSFVLPDVLTDAGRWVLETINRIPVDEVLAAPEPREVWGGIHRFLEGLSVRAYNEEFDRMMLERTFSEAAQGLSWGPPCGDNQAAWRRFPSCIMEGFLERFAAYSRTREDLTGPSPFRLAAALDMLGLQVADGSAHRALVDAEAAGAVALRIDAGFRPPEPEILARIQLRVLRDLPVFRAASAPTLPTFLPTRVGVGSAGSGSSIRPTGSAFSEMPVFPRISLRRTK